MPKAITAITSISGMQIIPFQEKLGRTVAMIAGTLMLRGQASEERGTRPAIGGVRRSMVLAVAGLGVGALTGLVGVGGGFLIVPALVLLVGVPMKRAIGTSLLVITLSTMTALAAYQGQVPVVWGVVALFTALAVVGALAGTRAARRVPGRERLPLHRPGIGNVGGAALRGNGACVELRARRSPGYQTGKYRVLE
jgi:uncharacterized membrane protein YfcA